MKVSTIITVYNLENFIEEAIHSVLRQTRKPDEIIVVDDGSTDNSVEIVKKFGSEIKLIQMKKNSGVLVSFIEGIKASSGTILSFLDGDDIWMEDKLDKVCKIFDTFSDAMMVTHLHQYIDSNGSSLNIVDDTHKNIKRIISRAHNVEEQDRMLKSSILSYRGVWLGSAFCVKRDAIDFKDYEQWVLELPGKELSHQDQPLAAYMIYTNPSKKIFLLNEKLFKYRIYTTNSSGSSANVESAIRTIKRSVATVVRTKNIVEQKPEWKEERFNQKMKLQELEFYEFIYTKKRYRAFKRYINLFVRYWNWKKKIKETQRIIACFLLGPENFLKMKTKQRFE